MKTRKKQVSVHKPQSVQIKYIKPNKVRSHHKNTSCTDILLNENYVAGRKKQLAIENKFINELQAKIVLEIAQTERLRERETIIARLVVYQ